MKTAGVLPAMSVVDPGALQTKMQAAQL